ncbi:MAG: hypothetical protein L0271_24770 [Gemmatimonadetes bacterium]|nr:hypothetical protein [Gemmatimonadota bacterium]
MTNLIIPGEPQSARRLAERASQKQGPAWGPMAVAGTVVAAAAAADAGLRMFPFGFGEPQWEATTMIALLDRVPFVLLGLALMTGAAIAQARPKGLMVMAILTLLFAVVTGFAAFLLLTAVPRVIGARPDAAVLQGLRRNTTRGAFEAVACVLGSMWIAFRAWQNYKKL